MARPSSGKRTETQQALTAYKEKMRSSVRRWATPEDMQRDFMAYVQHCAEKQLQPNVAGFCVFNDMHKDTFYGYKEYDNGVFSDSIKKIRSGLEDSLVNYNAFTGLTNPAMAIIQGKNTFGWDDSGRGGGDSTSIDVDFDTSEDELDNLMGKLGYLPKPRE